MKIQRLLFNFFMAACLTLLSACSTKNAPEPEACGPVPNKAQLAWQEMETYAFVHFSMNTFTGAEWGYGDISPKTFNPSELDCKQWVKVFKKAGLKGVILTTKHHDGFCLWPSKYTEYSVKNSPWRNGKGDLVRELSDACHEAGLKFGVYLSPWDRNHAKYGTPEYITYFRNQLTELLTNYGDIFEIWFDGANGGDGYYGGAREKRGVDRRNYYNFPEIYKLVYSLQPNAIIFSDAGPGCRWCGDEEGWVGETNWSRLRRDDVWPGYPHNEELRYGHKDGNYWVPAEINVSIRPGWFYHAAEDHQVKTVNQLVDIYYQSVGRNGNMLINFPVDRRGLIHEIDADHIQKMAQIIKNDLATDLALNTKAIASSSRQGNKYRAKNVIDGKNNSYWVPANNDPSELVITLGSEPVTFNRIMLQEYITLGQRVSSFAVDAYNEGTWKEIDKQTTIGNKRILRFPDVQATKVRVRFLKSDCVPMITHVGIYNAPHILDAPSITRSRKGIVTIHHNDKNLAVFYTTDNSEPTLESSRYTVPFSTSGPVVIKAITANLENKAQSTTTTQKFDILKKGWKILNMKTADAAKAADALFDGNIHTQWTQKASKMPISLTIDLGKTEKINGFSYVPNQGRWSTGIIYKYAFYISKNKRQWTKVNSGEFSNIKNSPIRREKIFTPITARYIKLVALANTEGDNIASYAEFDVITK